MNLETKITIYKFTPQVFTLTPRMGYTNKTNNKAIRHRQPLYMIRDSIYFLFQPE